MTSSYSGGGVLRGKEKGLVVVVVVVVGEGTNTTIS